MVLLLKINIFMINDIIEIEPTEFEDDGPLPFPEEELISQDEFRRYVEKLAFERLGIKLDLSPSNLATFD